MSNTERSRQQQYQEQKTRKFVLFAVITATALFLLNYMMDKHLAEKAAAARPVLIETRN